MPEAQPLNSSRRRSHRGRQRSHSQSRSSRSRSRSRGPAVNRPIRSRGDSNSRLSLYVDLEM